jgi:hypothetical protein
MVGGGIMTGSAPVGSAGLPEAPVPVPPKTTGGPERPGSCSGPMLMEGSAGLLETALLPEIWLPPLDPVGSLLVMIPVPVASPPELDVAGLTGGDPTGLIGTTGLTGGDPTGLTTGWIPAADPEASLLAIVPPLLNDPESSPDGPPGADELTDT